MPARWAFEFIGQGIDGQSTILYRITMGTVVASAPTVGSNHEVRDLLGVICSLGVGWY